MIAQLLGRVCLLSVVYTYRFDMDFSVADDHTIGRDKHFLFGLALPTVLYAPAVLMEFFFFSVEIVSIVLLALAVLFFRILRVIKLRCGLSIDRATTLAAHSSHADVTQLLFPLFLFRFRHRTPQLPLTDRRLPVR